MRRRVTTFAIVLALVGLAVIGAQIACKGDCPPVPEPTPTIEPTAEPTAEPTIGESEVTCPPEIANVQWCSGTSEVNCFYRDANLCYYRYLVTG